MLYIDRIEATSFFIESGDWSAPSRSVALQKKRMRIVAHQLGVALGRSDFLHLNSGVSQLRDLPTERASGAALADHLVNCSRAEDLSQFQKRLL